MRCTFGAIAQSAVCSVFISSLILLFFSVFGAGPKTVQGRFLYFVCSPKIYMNLLKRVVNLYIYISVKLQKIKIANKIFAPSLRN